MGRYESLQADFDIVCERIGIPRTPLPHENRSMDAPRIRSLNDVKKRIRRWLWTLRPTNVFPQYTDYYDDESLAFVAERYRKDIESVRLRLRGGGADDPTGSTPHRAIERERLFGDRAPLQR